MLAPFLRKKGGPGKVLLCSLLRCYFFSNFGVSGPSLDPIFFRFSRFGAPFFMRCGLYFAATAGATFRDSAANMLHSRGWWGYAKREEFFNSKLSDFRFLNAYQSSSDMRGLRSK